MVLGESPLERFESLRREKLQQEGKIVEWSVWMLPIAATVGAFVLFKVVGKVKRK